jgi:hypothetical protein
VQEVNGNLYVTYAKQNATKHDDFDFPGFGFVRANPLSARTMIRTFLPKR